MDPFCPPKEVLEKRPFVKGRNQYGYNDTFLGLLLEEAGCEIIHIDNPVYHLGFISAEKMLNRVPESLLNLDFLSKNSGLSIKMLRKIKLYRLLEKARSNKLIIKALLPLMPSKNKLRRRLLSDSPSLKDYNFYRLRSLFEFVNSEKKSS